MSDYAIKVPVSRKIRLTANDVVVVLQRTKVPWASRVRLKAITSDKLESPWLTENRVQWSLGGDGSKCRIRTNKSPLSLEVELPRPLATPKLTATVIEKP